MSDSSNQSSLLLFTNKRNSTKFICTTSNLHERSTVLPAEFLATCLYRRNTTTAFRRSIKITTAVRITNHVRKSTERTHFHTYSCVYFVQLHVFTKDDRSTCLIWTFLCTAGFRVKGSFLRPTEQPGEPVVFGVRVFAAITQPRRARATQTHAHVVVAVPVVEVVHSSRHPRLIVREVVPDPALTRFIKAREYLLCLIKYTTAHSCTCTGIRT